MKKLLWIVGLLLALPFLPSCNKDDDDKVNLNDYTAWKNKNEAWLQRMKDSVDTDGSPFYQTVVPAWNTSAYILMHYFNNREETKDNYVPLYTSVVDVRYIGYTCENVPFDSSTVENSYGKLGIRRFGVDQVIQGWAIALMDMHVGDTCEIIVPYDIAYGSSFMGSILPYSNLRFNLRLEDINKYVASPY